MAGESWSAEIVVQRKDCSLVPVIVNRAPVFDYEGNYAGATTIATDITKEKKQRGFDVGTGVFIS